MCPICGIFFLVSVSQLICISSIICARLFLAGLVPSLSLCFAFPVCVLFCRHCRLSFCPFSSAFLLWDITQDIIWHMRLSDPLAWFLLLFSSAYSVLETLKTSGSYGNAFGLTECVKCPKGTWTRAMGSIRPDQCSSWVKPPQVKPPQERSSRFGN